MDSLEELTKSNGKTGFFKHVFNFDDESKADMLNIIQYSKIPDKEDSNKKNSDRIIKLIKMVIDWKRCDLAKS